MNNRSYRSLVRAVKKTAYGLDNVGDEIIAWFDEQDLDITNADNWEKVMIEFKKCYPDITSEDWEWIDKYIFLKASKKTAQDSGDGGAAITPSKKKTKYRTDYKVKSPFRTDWSGEISKKETKMNKRSYRSLVKKASLREDLLSEALSGMEEDIIKKIDKEKLADALESNYLADLESGGEMGTIDEWLSDNLEFALDDIGYKEE